MTTKRPTLADLNFAKRVDAAEHAPGHMIMLNFFAAIFETDRFKNVVFLIAIVVAIGFNLLADLIGLPNWLEWLVLVGALVVYWIIARRRERRDAKEFEAARDAWLDENPAPNAADVFVNEDPDAEYRLVASEPYHDPKLARRIE